ncbi:MAG TPA: Asp23/Gls24 family envelope stress response protein [bacterium]|uniref:Alkaline shock protein 23 n=1 Tax=candidate division TA06 bacterium ADurb.Bin417 TaxID=1852828 RepID=A0A1V5MKB3_UNCT6|nr:MAG: hypothetical protein BWY73_00200 [candidate division TA06 bacterium ADurb.Bin417]HNQ36161.1 Asp23/Gls24 family envelope stress response protein [bacterium]
MAKENLGNVKIEHEVLAAIAAAAAGKVSGVSRIIPGFVGGLAELFGRSAPQHSVKVTVREECLFFELAVEVLYGKDVPQLAWEVQKAVKEAVEAMTGMRVAKVDVEVRGLKVVPEKA